MKQEANNSQGRIGFRNQGGIRLHSPQFFLGKFVNEKDKQNEGTKTNKSNKIA
jgi:hypothetical protein